MLAHSISILGEAPKRLTRSLGGLIAAGLIVATAGAALWPEDTDIPAPATPIAADRKSSDQLVEAYRAARPDTSADLLAALGDTLAALEDADQPEKITALDAYRDGDVANAVGTLESLARRQASGPAPGILDAAESFRQAGILAYTIDTERAIQNYDNAIAMTPSNPDYNRELGQVHLALGNYVDAEAAFLRLLQTDGVIDRRARAAALKNLGDVEINRTRYEIAAEYYRRSFGEYEAANDNSGMAEALVNLGVSQQLLGNLDGAELYHRRALTLYQQNDDRVGEARSLINLGQVEMTRTNIPLAEDYLRRGVSLNEELGQSVTMARGLANLGMIEKARGNIDLAEQQHRRALQIYEDLGDQAGQARELGNLGNLENDRGNVARAIALHSRSLKIDQEIDRKPGIATTLANLGGLAEIQGETAAACAYWQRAAAMFLELESATQYAALRDWMHEADCGLAQ